jgi:BirA family biotin operon repressor/biotin-[acetyl-CoA-carboxylase] ligase
VENCQALLVLLAGGEYISGAEIGRQLGISRAAVWKQVTRLRDQGVEIEACHHRGYRIVDGLSLLAHAAIKSHLCARASDLLSELDVVTAVSSTNDLAMERVKRGSANGYVCVAESQSAGKGRRGRTWISPFASNIYLSTVWRFEGGAASVEGLSLAVGVAIVRALEGLGFGGMGLKWPNDILWEQRKLGGVLLEIVGDPAGLCDVIVGVGVNVNMPGTVISQIDQPWVDLRHIEQQQVDRNSVVGALLNGLLPLLASFECDGFSCYQSRWQALDAYRDRAVALSAGQQCITGIARGVTAGGALLIDTPDGRLSFSGGEISLRAMS